MKPWLSFNCNISALSLSSASLFMVYNHNARNNNDDVGENNLDENDEDNGVDKCLRALNAILALAHKYQPLRIFWCKT